MRGPDPRRRDEMEAHRVMAKTFRRARRLVTTSKNGPPIKDVHRRIISDAKTGRVIDDRIVDDTPDEVLHRHLREEMDIRVELVMRDAIQMFNIKGVDVVEVFPPPRVAHAAATACYDGTRLTPGWSLDLTREDPKTGKPWVRTFSRIMPMPMSMLAMAI